ncbi:MAG: isoprenylcysteine carboxylmethyltransferase family protein [Verrucomicrobia bacterium]|nr:isoprenylcysteine carboxylmethyltransferase family protein [Verrucomicrobiota bacterium]MBV8279933.1 isoprenylcysteine carboxylmethyltransferase family protein [Verrucomicrobiota bacterium]
MLMKCLIRTVLWIGVFAILLFVPAGTINWTGGWIFLIETSVISIVLGIWLARYDPELLKERMRSPIQKEQSTEDKIVTGLILVSFFGWFAFMALDAVRFKWSTVPAWLQVPGAIGVLVACYIGYLTLRENTFAALVVKVQEERHQKVISTGPYRYVRHPMYAGMIFYLGGAPLLLGSWWGLLWGCGLLGLFAIRLLIEEGTLRKGLPGYNDYAAQVRYRLVPRVW